MAVQQESRREAGIQAVKTAQEDVMGRTIDALFTVESARGELQGQEEYGNTSGKYHIKDETRSMFKIDASLPEQEQARQVVMGFIGFMKNGNKDLGIPGINFDALTADEQVASLSYVYNAGHNQPNFRKALGHLARARSGKTDYDTAKLAKIAAGFMDVYKAGGAASLGLIRRRLSEQNVFINGGKINLNLDVNRLDGVKTIRANMQSALSGLNDFESYMKLRDMTLPAPSPIRRVI